MEISNYSNVDAGNSLDLGLQKDRINSQLYSDLMRDVGPNTARNNSVMDASTTILAAKYSPETLGIGDLKTNLNLSSMMENKGGIANVMA